MSKAYNTNIKKKKNIKLMIKNIIEFPSDIIIFSLDTNFCYTAFNKNYTEYLSATFDINVKIGDNILDVFKDYKDIKKEKINLERALSGVEFCQVGSDIKDKQTYYYKDIYKPILDESGNVFGVIVYYTNITNRKRSEYIWKVLLNISEKVSTKDNVKDFISYIRKELSKIIDTSNFFVALYNENNNTYTFPYFIDEKDKIDEYISYDLSKSSTDYVRKIGKALILDIEKTNELVRECKIDLIGTPSPSWIGIPLKNKGQTIGVMVCQCYNRENVYKNKDIELMEFISGHIAHALAGKQADEQLKKAKIKAEEADKLKSAFLANMSHEIRTPLNAIVGFSHLMTNNNLTVNVREKYANYIKSSADNLLKLINDIIDVAKIEAGQIVIKNKSVNVNEMLDELYASLIQMRKISKKNHIKIILNKSVKNNKFVINTDPLRLQQVLTNLLNNALKFTNKGHIEFGYYFIDHITLEFYVHDTGTGIPKNKEKLIFSRFGQVTNDKIINPGGTGLGLSISKHLVEALGGVIKFDSTINKGTNFYFTIPFIAGKNIDKIKTHKINYLKKIEKMKVLVVEDNKTNQALIYYLLEQNIKDCEIIFARTGEEAIDKFYESKETSTFDIVFMDIKLPDSDGYKITKYIRANEQDNIKIPIIGLSANTINDSREKSIKSGMNDFITKPIIFDVFSKILHKYASMRVAVSPTQKKEVIIKNKVKYKYIDLSILSSLYDGNESKFIKIVKLYSDNVQSLIVELFEIIETGTEEQIKLLAHNLKSSLLYLGMEEASEKAELIEQNTNVERKYICGYFNDIKQIWKKAYKEIKIFFYD